MSDDSALPVSRMDDEGESPAPTRDEAARAAELVDKWRREFGVICADRVRADVAAALARYRACRDALADGARGRSE